MARERKARGRSESPVPEPVTLRPPPVTGAAAERPRGWLAVWSALKLVFGVALVVGLAGSLALGARRYALTTPRFAIRKVDVQGAERLGPDAVAQLAGAELGTNIFTLEPARAEQQLLTNPWIREATVTRQLPNTLSIVLKENEASAILAVEDRLYLLTRGGEPFKTIAQGDPSDLPIVTGIAADELTRDRALAVERVKTGLEVLERYAALGVSRVQPAEEVHLTPEGSVILSVGRTGISLHLGDGPWAKKLSMAERVLERLGARGQTPGIVFLDNAAHPERVVVRMR